MNALPGQEPIDRAELIGRAARLGAGALAGGGAVALLRTAPARAQGEAEIEAVSALLALEARSRDFYGGAAAATGLDGALRGFAEQLDAQEAEHQRVLELEMKDLGGEPPAAPEPGAPPADAEEFLAFAIELEAVSQAAYAGAIAALDSPALLATLGSIGQVEARHSALVRIEASEDYAEEGALEPLAPADVEAALAALGAS